MTDPGDLATRLRYEMNRLTDDNPTEFERGMICAYRLVLAALAKEAEREGAA